MIDALTRTLWGVRRAAADGVPTEQRLEAARMIAAGTEAVTETATTNQPPTPNNQGAADGGHDG